MEDCCSNEKCNCSCHSKEEEGCHGGDNSDEFAGYFLDIADCAWEEVLKDKVKEYIVATQNDRMKELAKIIAEGNNQRWRHKMEKKHGCRDFQEKLCNFFSQSKK
jgi:N-acetylneuraminic acid mutarotase